MTRSEEEAGLSLDFEETERVPPYDEYTNFRKQTGSVSGPVFDPERWSDHINEMRRTNTLLNIFSSSIHTRLTMDVALIATFSSFIVWYNSVFVPTHGGPPLEFPMAPFKVVGPFLSLLLVFRTNASYGRWAEARALWGSVLNRSRDLSRQVITYVEDPVLADKLVRYIAAFPKTLLCHLRPSENLKVELRNVLTPPEIAALMNSHHKPVDCLNVISALLAEADVDGMLRQRMDQNVTKQHDNLGACERIYKTPIPLSYTRNTSRLMFLYVFLMPLALYKQIGVPVIPASVLITTALLGIEQIGILIEEPFNVLPVEKICDSAHMNAFKGASFFSGLTEAINKPMALVRSFGQPSTLADAPAAPPSPPAPIPVETAAAVAPSSTDQELAKSVAERALLGMETSQGLPALSTRSMIIFEIEEGASMPLNPSVIVLGPELNSDKPLAEQSQPKENYKTLSSIIGEAIGASPTKPADKTLLVLNSRGTHRLLNGVDATEQPLVQAMANAAVDRVFSSDQLFGSGTVIIIHSNINRRPMKELAEQTLGEVVGL